MTLPPEIRNALVGQAEDLCRANGAELLFLTLFGSTLYGTATPGKSDVDVRGVFLPSAESLALGKAPRSLHYSTGDGERRNTAEDLDIDLWSVQHWLLKLLPAGDTGALDVLFSPSNKDCMLYRDSRLEAVFANPLLLVDTGQGRAYAEYSLGQAKKYGIKGSRVGALKCVRNWLAECCPEPAHSERLRDHLDDIAAACGDGRFCAVSEIQEGRALLLCGKLHVESIRMAEFARRVEHDMNRYGARAEEAERNRGVDYKALSHAFRALEQMEELLQTGRIVFPLKTREELKAIKNGAYTWQELEPRILARLETIDAMQQTAPYCGRFDKVFAENLILSCYTAGNTPDVAPKASPPRFEQGFAVPADTLELVREKLAEVERENGVRILYACESGSRGWGFASEDSDFDVRFLYIHRPEWYLGIAPEENRDVLELGIEMTMAGELDINGWELRKALKLFRRSNPPLLEWLSSPLVYRELGSLASHLRKAVQTSFSPIRAWHHYRSLMDKSRTRFREKGPSIKTWFYVIRPLLAMRWIEKGRGAPPMRFDRLMDKVIADPGLRQELNDLVELKTKGAESDSFTPPPLAASFMVEEFERLGKAPPVLAGERGKADLDGIFRAVLAEAWPDCRAQEREKRGT